MEDFRCQVSLHPRFNHCKGIINTHEFDVENMHDFTKYMREEYYVISVQPATFIKTNEPNTKAFIVTFNQNQLPYSFYYHTAYTPRIRYATHFNCEIAEDHKRRFTPWLLEKCLEKVLDNRTKSKTIFTIEFSSAKESQVMQSLSSLNGTEIKTTVNTSLNICRGFIHVFNYNLADLPAFQRGLISQHGLLDVIEPHWIRSKNRQAKPLLLSFRNEIPQYIDIPGENRKSRATIMQSMPEISP